MVKNRFCPSSRWMRRWKCALPPRTLTAGNPGASAQSPQTPMWALPGVMSSEKPDLRAQQLKFSSQHKTASLTGSVRLLISCLRSKDTEY